MVEQLYHMNNVKTLKELYLSNNNLIGTISSTGITKLINLSKLFLFNNLLSGSIPNTINTLQKLSK